MPYWSAAPGLLRSTASKAWASSRAGKSSGAGSPPAKDEHVRAFCHLEDLPHRRGCHSSHAPRSLGFSHRASSFRGVMRVSSFTEQRTMVVWVRVTPGSVRSSSVRSRSRVPVFSVRTLSR